MATKRIVSRRAGFLSCYFTDHLLAFATKADGRSRRGRTWKNPIPLFKVALLCLAAGCKGLTEAEELMQDMPRWVRKMIGLPRWVSDTTLRSFLCKAVPEELCKLLYVVGYDAWRRGALRYVEDLPFHVMSLDGKYPSVSDVGESDNHEKSEYLQVHHHENTKEPTHGLVRTVTATLVSAIGRPIMAATPILGATNEQGSFKQAFGELVRHYGRLFTMVMYDAGATSLGNADAVIKAGKHYFFQVTNPEWVMYQTMELLFRGKPSTVSVEEEVSSVKRVVRELTILPVIQTAKNLTLWKHARSIVKVYSETYTDGEFKSSKTRYFITSMESSRLSAFQWLRLVILRWGVETSHGILDMRNGFNEDNCPWIHADANGNLVVQILRRIVYTLITLYRSVTLRNEEESLAPWRRQLEWFKETLKFSCKEVFENLRTRIYKVPPAFVS
ncbi:MAG: hypothetical protein R3C68_19630 [Myxococcota bacterium]